MNHDIDTTEPAINNDGYTPTKPAPVPIPEWMDAEVKAYDLDLAEEPATILDIGANIGAYTLRCAKKWPNARIIAYEPSRDNASVFRRNCSEIKGVSLEQAAVRRVAGQDLLLPGDMGATCGFHDLGRTSSGGYYVDCVAADELPEADLVKIDTEGCEVEILERLKTDNAKAIVCEFHRAEDLESIKDICGKRGFLLHHESKHSPSSGVLKFVRNGAIAHREVKLFIGLPVYSQMATQFSHCLLALQLDMPCKIELHTGQGDGVARTRNQLTAAFLKTDCTHMLMIDSDLIFAPYHVKSIISHSEDVVGGFYSKKQEGPLEWVINTYPGPVAKRSDGLHKVAYIGTGFMCIRRCVFEKMIAAYPHIAFGADYGKRDVQHDLWPMGPYCFDCVGYAGPGCTHPPASKRYLSEDWFFCQRWMDLGGSVYGDTRVVLKHIGPAIFPLITQQPEIENPKVPKAESKPSSDSAMIVEESTLTNEQV